MLLHQLKRRLVDALLGVQCSNCGVVCCVSQAKQIEVTYWFASETQCDEIQCDETDSWLTYEPQYRDVCPRCYAALTAKERAV